MTKKYSIELSGGITRIRTLQKLDLDDFKRAIREVTEINPGGLRLWDLSAGLSLDTAQLRELADFQKSQPTGDLRDALLVSEDLSFGLLRMYEVFRQQENASTSVFRNIEDAIVWLKTGKKARAYLSTIRPRVVE